MIFANLLEYRGCSFGIRGEEADGIEIGLDWF